MKNANRDIELDELIDEITAHGTLGVPRDPAQKADLYGCVRCHQGVGHGSAR